MNLGVITTIMQLHMYVSTLSQSEVDKIKLFLLTDNDYDTIKYEIRRRHAIEHDVEEGNKN